LLRFTDNPPYAVVKDGFGVGQVMQDVPNRPFIWAIALAKLLIAQVVKLERRCFCGFKSFDNFHSWHHHFALKISGRTLAFPQRAISIQLKNEVI
jgi:hypothetical protein